MRRWACLVVGFLLVAFALVALYSILPHAHPDANARPHDCSLCRAQSVRPLVETILVLGSLVLILYGPSDSSAGQLYSQENLFLPETRAPPLS